MVDLARSVRDMAFVYALMSIAGAWAAWHRSPLYAGQSAVRVLGPTALLVAVAVLAIVATVNLMHRLSEALQFVVMGMVIVTLSLGLILSIQAVATPKAFRLVTTLPPSAQVLTLHRALLYKWGKFAVGFLAVCGAGLLIPGTARAVFAGLGGIALLMAAIGLPLFYINARRLDRALTGLTLDPWIHWRYPAAQWQMWSDVQVARLGEARPSSLQRSLRKLLWPFAAIGAGVMIFSPLTRVQSALYVAVVWGLILAMLETTVWCARRAPAKLKARLHDVAPEVYMGRDGLYCNGRFLTWLGADYCLTAASVDARPPRSLLFRFEKMVPNPYGPMQTIVVNQSVLIPDGADGDVLRLAHELAVRCPSAGIALT